MTLPFGVGFAGIGGVANATFASALIRGTDEEKPVKVSTNGTVVLAGDDDQFIGFVDVIDDNDAIATVQIKGCVEVAYTGVDLIVGIGSLAGDGAGTIKGIANGAGRRLYHVYSVDTTAKTCILLIA